MERVEIRSLNEGQGGKVPAVVVIRDKEATVADYCQALDEYILKGEYRRLRSTATNCEGCDICCKERIPLTAIDVLVLKGKAAPGLSLKEYLQRFAYVQLDGRAIDITLPRDSRGNCIFLDRDTAKCLHYEARPLVCRTYICTAFSSEAEELRELLVNGGEDELVRLWFGLENAASEVVHEAWEPEIDPEDWQESSWSHKRDYSEVRLRDVLPEGLWRKLYQPLLPSDRTKDFTSSRGESDV